MKSLLLFAGVAAAVFDCEKLVVDEHTYNFHDLRGPHSVVTHEYAPPTYHNTTYTLDLCSPLKRKGDVPKLERCPDGTRICAITHRWDPKTKKTGDTDKVIPILVEGKEPFSWDAKRLSAGDSKTGEKDKDKKEGVKVTLSGTTKYQDRKQKTVIEFLCDADLKGDEGEWEGVDEYEPAPKTRRMVMADDGDEVGTPEAQLTKEGKVALIWGGYRTEADTDTLYLTWHTKFACDAAADKPAQPPAESAHWGFFTWFVILVFLGFAAYLIFGSWLNYTQHGARGWDLLPHNDTIRDLPYLLKEWIRRVLNTVQSSGSRGGYSAV
ncbi:autophagy-related protein 27 [Podospora australis]|uniref:Autophagy-related protein 27 n=1 Tax=Podospora australis TaxID=1536484 RepID=A0AAN7AIV9_9PEZI|nr:autophagy-related protein 27 [Podospora australis]